METYLRNLSRAVAYVLSVDGHEKWAFDTLEEAQDSASEFMASGLPLSIRCYEAPAPSRAWRYDYPISAWAEPC